MHACESPRLRDSRPRSSRRLAEPPAAAARPCVRSESDAARKQATKSAIGLLVAATLQVFCALVVAVAGAELLGVRGQPRGLVVCVLLGGGAVFGGLALWARHAALPAAAAGLLIMSALIAGEAVTDPAGWQNGLLVRTILAVAVLRATQTGLGHWRLRARARQPGAELAAATA